MSPITHTLISWCVAKGSKNSSKRAIAVITLAGVIPDLDGLGIIVDIWTQHTELFARYHHALHNLPFGILFAALAALIGKGTSRLSVFIWCLLTFHLHLFGDLIGSRGPDGYQWPIPYLSPFSSSLQLVWEGQWALNAWPNIAITAVFLFLVIYFNKIKKV